MRISTSWVVVVLAAMAVWAVSTTVNQAQTSGGSATAGGTKVGVVNIVRIFDNFEQTKVLNQKIEAHRQSLAQEAERKGQQIQGEQAALDAFAPGGADWYKRNEQLKKMVFEYKVWEALERDRISDNHQRWVEKTYDMITGQIAGAARKYGIQLVITVEELKTDVADSKALVSQIMNRKVVYADPSINLTEEVLANLNAEFTKAGAAASVEFTR